MNFQAVNPDFERAVRDSFSRQGLMVTLGVAIASVRPGEVVLELAARPELSQQHGFMHAGAGTAAVDSACGYAALTLAPAGHEVLTVELKNNFLRPADGEAFEAVGRVVKAGRQISYCEGELWQDSRSRLVMKFQATMFTMPAND